MTRMGRKEFGWINFKWGMGFMALTISCMLAGMKTLGWISFGFQNLALGISVGAGFKGKEEET